MSDLPDVTEEMLQRWAAIAADIGKTTSAMTRGGEMARAVLALVREVRVGQLLAKELAAERCENLHQWPLDKYAKECPVGCDGFHGEQCFLEMARAALAAEEASQ